MQGKGYRTSWDSYKGAFRSGYADLEWDDANVGFFSWAGGSNSTASGLYALAFGDTNQPKARAASSSAAATRLRARRVLPSARATGFATHTASRWATKPFQAVRLSTANATPISFNLRGLAAFAMGYNVTADQDHSFALGKFASNNGFSGTFIWSDGSATATADTFRNTANNEVAFRATGGFRFRTNLTGTTGCNLPAGSGVFNCTSSRFTKENFLDIKGFDVLSKLRNIPITSWNYIDEGKTVRHIGPMAEDFFAQFGLGTNNISIGVQDLAGVSLAAVKELDAQLQTKTEEVNQLQEEVKQLRATQSDMEKRLAALEEMVRQQNKQQ